MKETQKLWKLFKSETIFFVLTSLLIILLFAILSPKISSMIFPQKRQAILNDFINKTKLEGMINPQQYWQFREFYSPGYFTFSRTGITKSVSENVTNEIGIKYNQKEINLTDLFFSSQRLTSLDMLTKQSTLNQLIDEKEFQKGKIIFMSRNSLIYQKNPETIQIVFLLSNVDMQKANGFFDYKDKDKQLTEGGNWFNITSLKIN